MILLKHMSQIREIAEPVGLFIVYILRDVAVFMYADWNCFFAASDLSTFVLM